MLAVTAKSDEKPLLLYEQKIKAGLVYNLIKYTAWPETLLNKKLQVCLFGGDPFDGYLSPLDGRTAQQVVISIHKINKITETKTCHLLIIHQNQNHQLSELLEFLQAKNTLTVSDIKEFATHGGMVELAKENEKINLYINNTTVIQNGLKIDDRMLKLAKIVSDKEGI
jgi:hypothetical protein